MLFFRKRERRIAQQEKQIQAEKKKFHKKVDQDIESLERVNKVLRNGLALKVYKVGHRGH